MADLWMKYDFFYSFNDLSICIIVRIDYDRAG